MISRRAKTLFFQVAGPFMKLNGILYRYFRAPRHGEIKVHLGPGQKNYLEGWINIDANMFTGKCDAWIDLRNPLPFYNDSVDCFYSHHVIEHLPNLENHLKEVYRCLKPGGVYRLGGPSGDGAIAKFVEKDRAWFSDFPDKRESIGGKLENFIFCRGEHLTILTVSFLEELLETANFAELQAYKPVKETGYPEFFTDCLAFEYESDFDTPHTLVMEAVKPEAGRSNHAQS